MESDQWRIRGGEVPVDERDGLGSIARIREDDRLELADASGKACLGEPADAGVRADLLVGDLPQTGTQEVTEPLLPVEIQVGPAVMAGSLVAVRVVIISHAPRACHMGPGRPLRPEVVPGGGFAGSERVASLGVALVPGRGRSLRHHAECRHVLGSDALELREQSNRLGCAGLQAVQLPLDRAPPL
jgi:hypothetical protein